MIRFFKLEAEVPKQIANSNFCYLIWKPKWIVEVDFHFSFSSGTSKQIVKNQLPRIGFGVATANEWPKSTWTLDIDLREVYIDLSEIPH